MRDYFGDDGREIQDYMKRQVNKAGKPTYRVVLVGSGPREVETARRLSESNLISGLYYCPDMDAVCEISMKDFARSATVGAFAKEQDVVTFAKWCVADAVFVGPDRQHCISRQCEQELAAEGITVFAHDISAAIAEGKLSVAECLQGLAEEEEEKSSDVNGEKLVE